MISPTDSSALTALRAENCAALDSIVLSSACFASQKLNDFNNLTLAANQEIAGRAQRWTAEVKDMALAEAHDILGTLEMIPVVGAVAGAVDGVLYLVDGDVPDALGAFAAAIPGLGTIAGKGLEAFGVETNIARIACQAGRWGIVGVAAWRAGIAAYQGNWANFGLALASGILGFLTGGCFVAGTQVIVRGELAPPDYTGQMLDGYEYEYKNIEDVQQYDPDTGTGDFVLSQNADGTLSWKAVTQTYTNVVQSVRNITVRNEDGTTEVINATDQHPFYVEGVDNNGGYVQAGDLQAGMTLLDDNGNPATIVSITDQSLPDGVATYNFEVEDNHDYFVSDGTGAAVLVHNTVCRPSEALDNIIEQASNDLLSAENLREVVSEEMANFAARGEWAGKMVWGSAMHAQVGNIIENEESTVLKYVGNRGSQGGIDVVGIGKFAGFRADIITEAESALASHFSKYGTGVFWAKYARPENFMELLRSIY